MGLFGSKGKSRDELIAEAAELNEAPQQEEKKDDVSTGNEKIDIELTKVQGRLEGLDEVRKASSERFSRISEQIGELRGMIMDSNKAMGKVEVSSTKAVDLVESVHPEKLMIEVRRQDGKVEALRATIESNEAIMKDLMLELKKMRDKMSFYKGIEQVIQLNDEIKQELATIKKVEATIEQHADKVETIFVEVNKKFSEFDKFNDVVKDMDKSFKRMISDFEKLRTKVEVKQDRKEFVDLLDRFNEFEKHTTNLLKLIDERNKTVKDDLTVQFKKLVQQYGKRLEKMRPPTQPLPPQKEEPETGGSGEDGAGGDVKPSLFGRMRMMLGKSPVSEDPPEEDEGDELFPESENDIKAQEELAAAQAQAGKPVEYGVNAPKKNEEDSEEIEEPKQEEHQEVASLEAEEVSNNNQDENPATKEGVDASDEKLSDIDKNPAQDAKKNAS